MILMCCTQKFSDNWGQHLASSNKILKLVLAIPKLFERELVTLYNWFPLKVQCFNIWNCYAHQTIRLTFFTLVSSHTKEGFFCPAKLEVKICQRNELAMSLFQALNFVILCYLDSVWWMVNGYNPSCVPGFLSWQKGSQEV